jgi:hypothetical protein
VNSPAPEFLLLVVKHYPLSFANFNTITSINAMVTPRIQAVEQSREQLQRHAITYEHFNETAYLANNG